MKDPSSYHIIQHSQSHKLFYFLCHPIYSLWKVNVRILSSPFFMGLLRIASKTPTLIDELEHAYGTCHNFQYHLNFPFFFPSFLHYLSLNKFYSVICPHTSYITASILVAPLHEFPSSSTLTLII